MKGCFQTSIPSPDAICAEVDAIDPEAKDGCLIRQREEQLMEFKSELRDISRDLLSLDLDDSHALMLLQSNLDGQIFDNSLKLKRMLSSIHEAATIPSTTSDSKGVQLPKIDVPTFSGNILHWTSF